MGPRVVLSPAVNLCCHEEGSDFCLLRVWRVCVATGFFGASGLSDGGPGGFGPSLGEGDGGAKLNDRGEVQ